MRFEDLPANVVLRVGYYLDLADRARLAQVSKPLFRAIVPLIYAKIGFTGHKPLQMASERRWNHFTVVNNKQIGALLLILLSDSVLGFRYGDLVSELYLEDIDDSDGLNQWRNSLPENAFPSLKRYLFPTRFEVKPLTFTEAPKLDTLVIDRNFCIMMDSLHGMVTFINYENIKVLLFKGELYQNEDMMMFKLVTTFHHMINQLCEIHFVVDSGENYNSAYRRLVGFFAIIRKMNIPMPNINSITIPLTNQSSDSIVNLMSKHIIFENLTSLTILIHDDAEVLSLIRPIDKLGNIVRMHGTNIQKLQLKYELSRDDPDKNHLRSMMLLKFCESFHKLKQLKMELDIKAMNLSNLLMILGAPISNNLLVLNEIRIIINSPSENVINNIIPTLDDTTIIFPHLNFIHKCQCSICHEIFLKLNEIEKIHLEEQHNNAFFGLGRFRRTAIEPNPDLFSETLKIGTVLIVGQELDKLEVEHAQKFHSDGIINKVKGDGLLRNPYPKGRGFLFDHLIRNQLNQTIQYNNIQILEICGLVYHRTDNGFQLSYGEDFQGLDDEQLVGMVDLGHMFSHG